MAETNRVVVSRVREDTANTTPTSPAFKEVLVTGANLSYGHQRQDSATINNDLQPRDQVNVGYQPGGALPIEFRFKCYDDELEEAARGTWDKTAERDNAGTADSVITAVTASSDTYTVTDASEDFVVGHLVLASGFTNSGNNQLFRAQTSTSGTSVIAPSSPGLTDESAPPADARLKAVGFEGASGDITATATGLGSTSLDFTTLGIPVGGWVWVGGDSAATNFATAACKGWARVSAVAAQALTFDILPTGWTTDNGSGKTVQVFFGDLVTTGRTKRTVTIERRQEGLSGSNVYEYFKGQAVSMFELPLTANNRVTGSIGYVGNTVVQPTTTRLSGATDTAAPTSFPVLSTAVNIGSLLLDGVQATTPSYITELGLTINNGVERNPALQSQGGVSVLHSEVSIGGSIKAYFGDSVLAAAAYARTAMGLMFRIGMTDSYRQAYVFDAPRTILNGEVPAGAKNQSRYFEGTWRASKHSTLGYAMSIGRFWYLPAAANS